MGTYKLGLSLRGGGAQSAMHVGFLKALSEAGIRPDSIIASSGGAVVAAGFACGLGYDELLSYSINLQGTALVGINSLTEISVWDVTKAMDLANQITIGKSFSDLDTKLFIQVTNARSGESRVLTDGPLSEAVAATCAFPFLMAPIKIDGEYYIDGALSSGNGVKDLREHGAEKVVIVSSEEPTDFETYSKNPVHRIAGMIGIGMYNVRRLDLKENPPDLYLEAITGITNIDFGKAKEIAEFGYKFGIQHVPQIEKLITKHWFR